MTNQTSAAHAHVSSLLLCVAVLSGLAACGTEGAASAARAAGTDNTLVSPSVGTINRAPTTPSSPTTTTPPTASNPGNGNGNGNPNPPAQTTSGAATLDWNAPTQNSDGTALTNLAGYTVYYGTSPSQLTQSVKVANPGLTAYTLNNLAPGTWYFTVTSYTSTGVESAPTGVVSTTI